MMVSNVLLGCIVVMIVLFCTDFQASAAEPSNLNFNPNVCTYKVGDFQVSLLCEGNSEGDAANLVADEALIQKYAPGGTYPSAINVFLIKTPERRILVDAGLGRELFKNLESLGLKAGDIDAVLLTHMHGDHFLGLLKDGRAAFPKAKLYMARQERDYWGSEEIMKAAPADDQDRFKDSRAALAAYEDVIQLFEPDALGSKFKPLLPGIQPIAAFGHTPGQTIFLLESRGEKLLIWGDVTHSLAVQLPVPEVTTVFDVDSKQAAATRLAVLKYVSEEKIPIAGMHIRTPGMGRIAPAPQGGYSFTPFS